MHIAWMRRVLVQPSTSVEYRVERASNRGQTSNQLLRHVYYCIGPTACTNTTCKQWASTLQYIMLNSCSAVQLRASLINMFVCRIGTCQFMQPTDRLHVDGHITYRVVQCSLHTDIDRGRVQYTRQRTRAMTECVHRCTQHSTRPVASPAHEAHSTTHAWCTNTQSKRQYS